jgi:hypothetical protein
LKLTATQWLSAFLVVFLAITPLFGTVSIFWCGFVRAEVEEAIAVNVYVICLNGVNASGVNNMSESLTVFC